MGRSRRPGWVTLQLLLVCGCHALAPPLLLRLRTRLPSLPSVSSTRGARAPAAAARRRRPPPQTADNEDSTYSVGLRHGSLQVTRHGGGAQTWSVLDNLVPSLAVKAAGASATSRPLDLPGAASAAGGAALSFDFPLAASSHTAPLGALRCARWVGGARIKRWWAAPAWGEKGGDLPLETQWCLMELEDNGASPASPRVVASPAPPLSHPALSLSLSSAGPYCLLLPLLTDGGDFRASLRRSLLGSGSGVSVTVSSGDPAVRAKSFEDALVAVAGDDPYV